MTQTPRRTLAAILMRSLVLASLVAAPFAIAQTVHAETSTAIGTTQKMSSGVGFVLLVSLQLR